MIKTTDFAEIISSTQKLKTADLDKLRTKEEKVSFFEWTMKIRWQVTDRLFL
jgi:hypothetical protein